MNKLDIKTAIAILTIATTLGGFYYTTQLRLDDLEEKVTELEEADAKLRKRINRKLGGE